MEKSYTANQTAPQPLCVVQRVVVLWTKHYSYSMAQCCITVKCIIHFRHTKYTHIIQNKELAHQMVCLFCKSYQEVEIYFLLFVVKPPSLRKSGANQALGLSHIWSKVNFCHTKPLFLSIWCINTFTNALTALPRQ